MSYQLSEGAIRTIMNGGEYLNPVVQILGSKAIPAQSGATERYRLLISDGEYLNSFAMLATQLTPMLTSGQLSEYSVVKITNHVVSAVKNDKGSKRIMIILEIDVLKPGSEVGMKIGNPVPFTEGAEKPKTQEAPNASTQPARTQTPRRSINDTVYNTPSATRTHPIVSLSPYQNNWVIKARVMSKSPMRTWSNAKSEGKLFSIDLIDESGEIRATAFKEQADKYFDLIEENKIYYISKCILKMANKKFSTLKNDYEMTFTNDTKVIPCVEQDDKIPTLQFNFQSIATIQEAEAGALIDFIGVCKSASDVVNLTSRTTNKELKKREVIVVDPSLSSVVLTLWGQQAEDFSADTQPVVAIRAGKVSEFGGGKTVSLIGSSSMQINPDIPEAHRIRGWFDCLTDDTKFNSVSSRLADSGNSSGQFYTIAEAKAAKLGCSDKADYFNLYSNILYIKTDKCVYKACPTPDCQKKVIDQNTGQYRCEKCNKEFDNFKYRLMLTANIGDFTGNQWITMFQDSAEELLSTKADDVGRWQEEDGSQFNEVFKNVTLKPYVFRVRAKMETFNDENRLKLTAFSVKKPDYKERCTRLISEIKEMAGIQLAN
ncbi:replication protein A 70 kDa DNA-binding subunit [Cimex lectularius]|uniref:Replication protein A subunit n=1 Tax=Cimex lectularius TaxID=79782 RepID=A0A8I6RC59_CIMLE|nr:replication protein A 70 kDa DNA-binding subunit [Cimex lectularius]